MSHRHIGFTIVELLIVIVVVAILAAISIVAYTGIQNRAHDSIIQQDLATIAKKLELAKVDLEGRYPISHAEFPSDARLTRESLDTTSNNVYFIVNNALETYSLGVRSKSRQGYVLTNGKIVRVASLHAASTADTAGLAWDGERDYRVQAYQSTTSTWSTAFPLVRP